MFARIPSAGSSAVARAPQVGYSVGQQVRCAASIKTLKLRMRSIESMMKITKAMKMVAAAKLKHDERRMSIAIPFVQPVQNLFDRLPQQNQAGTTTFVGVTGDKGLCGGVNTAVAKACRLGMAAEEAQGNATKFTGIGAKGATALKRLWGDRFTKTYEEVVKVPWTFGAASIVAESLIASDPARLRLCSNKFVSMVSYDTVAKPLVTMQEAKTMDRAEWSKAMDVYSFEPSIYEAWDDLHEFYYATAVHGAYLEGAVSEQSARMGAMENASKNAGEMLEKISLQYNRARQAKITTELCEIISGASAV